MIALIIVKSLNLRDIKLVVHYRCSQVTFFTIYNAEDMLAAFQVT